MIPARGDLALIVCVILVVRCSRVQAACLFVAGGGSIEVVAITGAMEPGGKEPYHVELGIVPGGGAIPPAMQRIARALGKVVNQIPSLGRLAAHLLELVEQRQGIGLMVARSLFAPGGDTCACHLLLRAVRRRLPLAQSGADLGHIAAALLARTPMLARQSS